MSEKYYLVIDAGTTSVKVFGYSSSGEILCRRSVNIPIRSPRPGWVEQEPLIYWDRILDCIKDVCDDLGKPLALGVTNQRASTVVWDRVDGEPMYNMITWQDMRASDLAEELSRESLLRIGRFLGKVIYGFSKVFKFLRNVKAVKLLITLANFRFGSNQPAIHLRWLMDNVEGFRKKLDEGRVAFGTLDSWILWKLLGLHLMDYTNASATGFFDPFKLRWSGQIMDILGIPESILPRLVDCSGVLGSSRVLDNVPVASVIADQQASLFSIGGVRSGVAKMTNGTGTFIDVNVGPSPVPAMKGTYPMVAVKCGDIVRYLVEGIVQSTGSSFDWLRDIGLIDDPSEVSEMAFSVEDCFGVVFVPTFAGIGSPYWFNDVRGCVFGLSRGVRREHIVRALVEGIAFRLADVILLVEEVSGIRIERIFADGNASSSDALLQFTADFSGRKVCRVSNLEGSSRGAFLLARSAIENISVEDAWISPTIDRVFEPRRGLLYERDYWRRGLDACFYFHGLR